MRPDERPVLVFDYGPGNRHERLITEALQALERVNGPVRQLSDALRPYMTRHRVLEDWQTKHLLKIISRYVDVRPKSWTDFIKAVGWDVAAKFSLGAEPPPAVFDFVSEAEAARADRKFIVSYLAEVRDLMAYPGTINEDYLRLIARSRFALQQAEQVKVVTR